MADWSQNIGNYVSRLWKDQGDGTHAPQVALTTEGYSSSVALTRKADTTAYTAGDVLGPESGTSALTFTAGAGAGEYLITSASLLVPLAAVPSGMGNFRLHLYNVTPPSAYADNAAWDLPAGDRASYLGYVDLGTPVDVGSTLYVEANQLNKQITLASASLFAYLQTQGGGYTPASGTIYTVGLHTVRL